MRQLLLAAALALGLPACGSLRAPHAVSPSADPAAAAVDEEPAEAAPDAEGGSTAGFLWGVLMYLPNRVLDLFDMARAGVNVGPGIGAQLKATDAGQLLYLSRVSAGVGLQGLRHLPAYASVEAAAAVGPLGGEGNIGIGWYQSPTDIRVEVHPLLAGAHVAVDPVEILDFLLGFLTIDIRDDDF